MEGLAVQQKDSQRNTAFHCMNNDQNTNQQIETEDNKLAHLWDDVLTPKERAALLDKAGLKDTGYFKSWANFLFRERYVLRLTIKKAALWQVIAGIN